MTPDFKPGGLTAWIGSLPVDDHKTAVRMMMAHTPDIPLWVQLPVFKSEGMIAQFLPGMPGLRVEGDRRFIQAGDDWFEAELLAFFEAYMQVIGDASELPGSRFALTPDIAPGFFELLSSLDAAPTPPFAVKGQVTGPFTFATGMTDQNGRAIFYDDQLRDAAVKSIALKARWQVNQLKRYKVPVILFLDEPGLAGFGSSAFISVSRRDVAACLEEVMDAVHLEGGLAGVHVCANAEWPVILESSADIVSFDAYSFFDKFILYPKEIKAFLDAGKIIAWGIVPTGDIRAIQNETVDSLAALWESEVRQIENLGFDRSEILAQSLITPSCGTGSLPLDVAERVIRLTREVSERVRGIG
ncbi:MAG: hypothetical protein WA081_14000 [Desulfosalsimonadaceae bacterium]